jgi:hypothetical protein
MFKLVFPLLLSSASAYAATPAPYGTSDCRIGALLPLPVEHAVTWNGACKDGFADGPGTLAWNDAGNSKRRVEGTLDKGVVRGEAKLTYQPKAGTRGGGNRRTSYEGPLRDGLPDGQGFFQYAQGDMYEGGVAAGEPHGTGIYLSANRDRYEGDWVAGKREGHGKATFAAGGSYDGAWKNDQFDGPGTIVYAGAPRTWTGTFIEGRQADVARPVVAEPIRYNVPRDRQQAGSRIPELAASLSIPPAASWAQLSVAERNRVIALAYVTLAPGDEPPYPVDGVQAILKQVSTVQGKFDYHGPADIFITVGSDGKARSASVVGKAPKELARQLSAIALAQAYKPAMCQGTPCEMIYPFRLYLLEP